jgi:hypothetical protein
MRIVARGAVTRTARLVPLLIALLVLLAVAQVAAAAPPGPTMDLEQLAVALESGPLDGYLLTTMDGTTPEPITVQVQSLVDYSWGSLILFEASGPWIDRIGGIAAGMSGSPIYVQHEGVDKLVGALSYGDAFTLEGLGLATPIEYMAAIEEDFPVGALAALEQVRPPVAGAYALDAPVATSGGVVRSVRIARSAQAAAGLEAAAGQTVMAPLGLLEIGGAKPGSAAFERVAARFAKSGLLVRAATGDGAWAGAPTPDLGPGSPCAILFSEGALWVGAAGTVTYVDGDTAMLFGHPFEQFGDIEAHLTGGDVQGVWASSYIAYKLIAPRDVKGACVQDRNWGVAAHLGQAAETFPVTTTATVADRGVTALDESSVCQWLFTGGAYPTLPSDIVSQAVYRAVDQYSYPGSAETTTTVVVSDGTGTYTVSRDNLWSDPYDIVWMLSWDANDILWMLADDPDGVLAPQVESVDVTTTVSPAQRSARIAGVTLADGWGHGENTVRVDYYRYGSAELQTLEGALIVPAGTSLYGRLTVRPANLGDGFEGEGGEETDTAPPRTLADLVDELNALPRNSDLVISYQPGESDEGGPDAAATIDTTVSTDSVFTGYFSAQTMRVTIEAAPRKVAYGGAVNVAGEVDSTGDVTVEIYRRYAGSDAEVRVATTTAVAEYGAARFQTMVPGIRKNATLIARVTPTDGSLPGAASASVRVSPRIWLSGAARLAIRVRPGDADGRALLQRKRGGVWRDYKTVKIVSGEGFTGLPKGTHVLRAHFSGSPLCTAGTSRAFTIRVP